MSGHLQKQRGIWRDIYEHFRSVVSHGRKQGEKTNLKVVVTPPTSKERWLRGRRRAQRSYPTLKVRKGGGEEIPLLQGKEQHLCFAGAALKRYPTSKVTETQVRW